MKKFRIFSLFILPLLAWGCSKTSSTNLPFQPEPIPNPAAPQSTQYSQPVVKLVEAYPNISFKQPVEYVPGAEGSNLVYVVEKGGKIWVLENSPQVLAATLFIDLGSRVDSSASEKGLLGLTFHPRFAQNGYFYVNYTTRTSTVIARYQVDPQQPGRGMMDSETVLLTFAQPYANHNGGHMAFGPDGYLYIATGDGGSAGDPQRNAQNLGSLLGKILRIDVDNPGGGLAYGIPPDNPWAGNQSGYRQEIYAYGLRNPWKFSFDNRNGRLWVADVGQDTVEEIDLIEKGRNYGWNIMEGSLCYPASRQCNSEGLQLPIWEYRHPLGKSITGGYVYYGSQIPGLTGAYIYGDFVTGLIWSLRIDQNNTVHNDVLAASQLNISSFGLDQNGEIYIIDLGGKIYKFQQVS